MSDSPARSPAPIPQCILQEDRQLVLESLVRAIDTSSRAGWLHDGARLLVCEVVFRERLLNRRLLANCRELVPLRILDVIKLFDLERQTVMTRFCALKLCRAPWRPGQRRPCLPAKRHSSYQRHSAPALEGMQRAGAFLS